MRAIFLALVFAAGFLTHELVMLKWPLSECVYVPGEKGRDGVGDGGDGIFCRTALLITPGRVWH